jgi:hypothetical protein
MKTHVGGCHCGNVKFEVQTDLAKVMECNCSHCAKRGFLLTFVPPEQFKLTHGNEGELRDYRFNKQRIAHLSCPACGVESYMRGKRSDGSDVIGINVRCLEEVDAKALTITHVDGKSF